MPTSRITRHQCRLRTGSILILVLIVVSTLTIMSLAMIYRSRTQMKTVSLYARRTAAYYLALGGMARAKVQIRRPEITPVDTMEICSLNSTAEEENLFAAFGEETMHNRRLWYCVRDEQGYLDLQSSDPASWANIEHLSRTVRAGILDWQDEDDEVRPEGAETSVYQQLQPPYVAKNGPVTSLKELTYVSGVDAQLYSGEDMNHNDALDDNEKDGLTQPPWDNGNATLEVGLVDLFTVYGSAQVNINTAAATILASLPGIGEAAVETILSHRAGPDGRAGTQDDVSLESAGDIGSLEGLS